jgi:formyl-CoA transferase/CoA:oxalate CoA-transferase
MEDRSRVHPLDGVKVLDFTRQMAGPYGTVFLADYGADVVKVESMPEGDASRETGAKVDGKVSGTFLMWNRGKRSVALDLRRPEAIEVVQRLAVDADVLVENYKPGVAERIGIGYDALAALNPRLVYVSLSAFGRGPLEPFPGTDPVVQAVSGVMAVTGEQDGDPVLVGVPIADFTGSMMVGQAVLLGLLARERTGEGQRIELSMLYGMLSSLTTRLATYWATGVEPTRHGGSHSVVMPYQVWETADGHIVAGVWNGGNVMWPKFCDAVDLPELAEDPRYATNPLRLEHRNELAKVLADQFRTRTTAEWEQRFHRLQVLFGPVYRFSEILAHPHVQQAGIVGTVDHPMLGPIPQLGPVIGLTKTPGELRRHPPLHGEHTLEVLEAAGYSRAEIGALVAAGIAGVADTGAA